MSTPQTHTVDNRGTFFCVSCPYKYDIDHNQIQVLEIQRKDANRDDVQGRGNQDNLPQTSGASCSCVSWLWSISWIPWSTSSRSCTFCALVYQVSHTSPTQHSQLSQLSKRPCVLRRVSDTFSRRASDPLFHLHQLSAQMETGLITTSRAAPPPCRQRGGGIGVRAHGGITRGGVGVRRPRCVRVHDARLGNTGASQVWGEGMFYFRKDVLFIL